MFQKRKLNNEGSLCLIENISHWAKYDAICELRLNKGIYETTIKKR